MCKKYNDGFTCLPYERMTPLQRLLTDEGVSSLLGLQYKKISEKRILNTIRVLNTPVQRKPFAEWTVAIDEKRLGKH